MSNEQENVSQLRADLLRNIKNIPSDPKAAIREMWAFLEVVVDEMEDMDGSIADMAEQADDLLQPETAQLFLIVCQGAKVVAMELARLMDPKVEGNAAKIAELHLLIKRADQALGVIDVITIAPREDEEDDDEEPDQPDAPDATAATGAKKENSDADVG